jgi:hypothetical protein
LLFVQVRKIRVARRSAEIVGRLNKTKEEKQVDFRAEKEKRDRLEREDKKRQLRAQQEQEKIDQKKKMEEKEMRFVEATLINS